MVELFAVITYTFTPFKTKSGEMDTPFNRRGCLPNTFYQNDKEITDPLIIGLYYALIYPYLSYGNIA